MRERVGYNNVRTLDAPAGDSQRFLAEVSEGIFVAAQDRGRKQTNAKQGGSSRRHCFAGRYGTIANGETLRRPI